MPWALKYFLATLPAGLILGIWQLAAWAFDHFSCRGNLKNLQPCFAGSFDLLPLIGFGLFWCQLLKWPAILLSFWLLIEIASRHIGSRHAGNLS